MLFKKLIKESMHFKTCCNAFRSLLNYVSHRFIFSFPNQNLANFNKVLNFPSFSLSDVLFLQSINLVHRHNMPIPGRRIQCLYRNTVKTFFTISYYMITLIQVAAFIKLKLQFGN